MNNDEMKGQWKTFTGKAKEKWGKLTDNDFKEIEGKKDQIVGKIQQAYGKEKDEAEREYTEWKKANRL
jgi:uncharacterized protein YjbJ (UPF0337 family)